MISALFGGLLTKVGVYALMRVMVMLLPMGREEFGGLIAVVAIATMIVGALGALAEIDIRRMLGYIVICGIGNMLAGVALGSVAGLGGAIFYALHSMVLMTALYLAAGEAGRIGGSHSLNGLSGLWTANGAFAALSLVLFLAASGLPPFSGFWPKVMLVKAALAEGAWWLAGVILLTGFLTTIVFGRVFLLAYWRPAMMPMRVQPVTWRAGLPLTLLAALVVGFGLFPERLAALSIRAAAGLDDPSAYMRSVFPEGGAK